MNQDTTTSQERTGLDKFFSDLGETVVETAKVVLPVFTADALDLDKQTFQEVGPSVLPEGTTSRITSFRRQEESSLVISKETLLFAGVGIAIAFFLFND